MPEYIKDGYTYQALRSEGDDNKHILDTFQLGNNFPSIQLLSVAEGDWLVFNNDPDNPEFFIVNDDDFRQEYVIAPQDIKMEDREESDPASLT